LDEKSTKKEQSDLDSAKTSKDDIQSLAKDVLKQMEDVKEKIAEVKFHAKNRRHGCHITTPGTANCTKMLAACSVLAPRRDKGR